MSNTTKFQLGQAVWDEVFFPGQEGVVNCVDLSQEYQIGVRFGKSAEMYTSDGSYDEGLRPTLSTAPYTVKLEGFTQKPPRPHIEKDTLIYVRRGEAWPWEMRYFSRWADNGMPLCLDDQVKSNETTTEVRWRQYSLTNPLLP